jgi:hypothetical protein
VLVEHKIIFLPAKLQTIWQDVLLRPLVSAKARFHITYTYTHFVALVNISCNDGDRGIQVTKLQRVTSEGLRAATKLSIQLQFRRV